MTAYELADELEKAGTVDWNHLKLAAAMLRTQADGIELLLKMAHAIDEALENVPK
jgi:hypothetical protein